MKKTRKTLVALLVITIVLVSAAGAYLKYVVFAELDMYQDDFVITVPFQFLADDSAQYALNNSRNQNKEDADDILQTQPQPVQTEPAENLADVPEQIEPSESLPQEPEVTKPEPLDIDESWFDDVLFIGDSRTVGLRDIARLGDAHYFCDLSMTVFKVMNYSVYDKGFGKAKLGAALDKNEYGKIYIHLGLNECATRMDLIVQKFQELIDMIQEKQPDAVIILQSVMTVSESKAKDPKFSMKNIVELNQELQKLAEINELIYLDTNDWAADEEGFLRKEIRMDGAHPTGTGYREWAQWIIEQARYFGIP